MTPSSARNIDQPYIGPEHQLHGRAPLSNEEAALRVVDEIYVLYKRFKHTRTRGDLLAFIARALYLEQLGYVLLAIHGDCIVAHKKGAPNEWLH